MSNETKPSKQLKIAFIHPDLGIERLVVDAGLGIQNLNHKVEFFTSHHSKNHCFKETSDGTLKVTVYGDFLPRSIFGFFHVFFAILRMIYVSFMVVLFHEKFDVFFVDQVSVNIPILKWFTNSKIVFYCHHPDKLLAIKGGMLKNFYRLPFDYLEEKTTDMAHTILVNSKYTQSVFTQSFPSIHRIPFILYPSINCKEYDKVPETPSSLIEVLKGKRFVTSINRFERKKNIMLAVESFAKILKNYPDLVLVLAGGYDERVKENVEVLDELKQRVKKLSIESHVIYLPSFTNSDRYYLLNESKAIIYTPENEHLGIVPIEAQYCGRAVVACNSGGPLETIIHKETGFLVDSNADAFSSALEKILSLDNDQYKELSKKAHQNAKSKFTLEAFANNLQNIFYETLNDK